MILALASLAPVHGQYQVCLESKQSAWAMRKPTTIECQLPPEEKPNKRKALFFLPVVTPHPVRAYACSKEVRTVCTDRADPDTLLLVLHPGRSLRKNPGLGSPMLDHGEGVQSSQQPHAREAERASVWNHRAQGTNVRAPRRGVVEEENYVMEEGEVGVRSGASMISDLADTSDCSALAQNCTTGAEVVVWEAAPATSFCSHKRMETLVETLVTSDRIMVDQYSMGFFRSKDQETGRLEACVPEGSIRLENDAFIWFIDGEEEEEEKTRSRRQVPNWVPELQSREPAKSDDAVTHQSRQRRPFSLTPPVSLALPPRCRPPERQVRALRQRPALAQCNRPSRECQIRRLPPALQSL